MERTGSGGQGEDGHAAGGGAGTRRATRPATGPGTRARARCGTGSGRRSRRRARRSWGRARARPVILRGQVSPCGPVGPSGPVGPCGAVGLTRPWGPVPGAGPAAGFGAFGRRPEGGGASARGAGPLASFAYTAADEEKQRGVRRMKLTATGLLLFVAVVYVLATWAKSSGVGGWPGYVAAAAEAGMVGALADWFAVTALFRRRSACPSRTPPSSPPRRISWDSPSVPSLARTFCPERSFVTEFTRWASAGGSVCGSRSPRTPTGSPPSWRRPCAAR